MVYWVIKLASGLLWAPPYAPGRGILFDSSEAANWALERLEQKNKAGARILRVLVNEG